MSFYVPSVIPDLIGNLSRSIDDYPEGIVLPVDKPYRWTSADVIRKLKYAAIKHFGKKNLKVGHAGTLDPLATGVLLVCIGNACKRAQELQDHDKEYIATIRFGATTPSYDLEKVIDRRLPFEHITEDAVRAALPSFLGEQEQIAPLFSAKSVDGVRAYELARKMYKRAVIPGSKSVIPGLTGNLPDFDSAALETLQRSRITVSELELLSFRDALQVDSQESVPPTAHEWEGPIACDGRDEDRRSEDSRESTCNASARINVADTSALGLPEAVIRIACSKGTYIRAFARDLGEALDSGAHLAGLVRSRSGSFRVDDALSLDQALSLLSV